ncbi:MAG: hypothetical protein KAV00_03025, partial [Phycisphaerae bacterium]|nr:hypothetical protein [Phycisphaerae bacterium]
MLQRIRHWVQSFLMQPRKKSKKTDETNGAPVRRHDEDAALMLEFQAGRAEAFREIVQRNQDKVYSVVFRIIGNHA